MRKIKVITGGCGVKYIDVNGNARHALKTAESEPFECEDDQAERLVRLGVAEYVGELAKQEEPNEAPAVPSSEKVYGHLDAKDLETWGYNELKKLAADMHVKPKSNKKADLIAAIVAEEVELGPDIDPDDEDLDELPDLSAADPE